jgi:hypothetical protein
MENQNGKLPIVANAIANLDILENFLQNRFAIAVAIVTKDWNLERSDFIFARK